MSESPPEPPPNRWIRDYAIFVFWSTPALLAAAFAKMILTPKLAKVLERKAEFTGADGDIFKMAQAYGLFFDNAWLLFFAALLLSLPLDLLVEPWRCRWRLPALCSVAFLINLAVLVALILFAIVSTLLSPR